jgi:hypothetical protein
MVMIRNKDGERCLLRRSRIALDDGNDGIVFGT